MAALLKTCSCWVILAVTCFGETAPTTKKPSCPPGEYGVISSDGSPNCRPCSSLTTCPAGMGMSTLVLCGDIIPKDTNIHCVDCVLGKTYSSTHDGSLCQLCHSTMCYPNVAFDGKCTIVSDTTRCTGNCKKGFYPRNGSVEDCQPCSPCLGQKAKRVLKCFNDGMPSRMQCGVTNVIFSTISTTTKDQDQQGGETTDKGEGSDKGKSTENDETDNENGDGYKAYGHPGMLSAFVIIIVFLGTCLLVITWKKKCKRKKTSTSDSSENPEEIPLSSSTPEDEPCRTGVIVKIDETDNFDDSKDLPVASAMRQRTNSSSSEDEPCRTGVIVKIDETDNFDDSKDLPVASAMRQRTNSSNSEDEPCRTGVIVKIDETDNFDDSKDLPVASAMRQRTNSSSSKDEPCRTGVIVKIDETDNFDDSKDLPVASAMRQRTNSSNSEDEPCRTGVIVKIDETDNFDDSKDLPVASAMRQRTNSSSSGRKRKVSFSRQNSNSESDLAEEVNRKGSFTRHHLNSGADLTTEENAQAGGFEKSSEAVSSGNESSAGSQVLGKIKRTLSLSSDNIPLKTTDNIQLLDEVEHDIKNYQGRERKVPGFSRQISNPLPEQKEAMNRKGSFTRQRLNSGSDLTTEGFPKSKTFGSFSSIRSGQKGTSEETTPILASEEDDDDDGLVMKQPCNNNSQTYSTKTVNVSQLNAEVFLVVCRKLNQNIRNSDWRTLAGKMGYSNEFVKDCEREKDPANALLSHWGTKSGNDVTKLIELLTKMDRNDIVRKLESEQL